MFAFGHSFAQILQTGDIIALEGDLGAGKSTLARGLIAKILADAGHPTDDIPSPTFTLVQSYPWADTKDPGREIWHMDLWRLDGPDEVIELGFEDALGRHAMLIEWPDRLQGLLSDQVLTVTIQATQDGAGRSIDFTHNASSNWASRLKQLQVESLS